MSEQNLLNYNLFKANNNNFQFDYSIPPTITTNHEISAIQQRTVTFFFFFFFYVENTAFLLNSFIDPHK